MTPGASSGVAAHSTSSVASAPPSSSSDIERMRSLMPAPPTPSGAVPSHARAVTWPSRAGRRARRLSRPRTSPSRNRYPITSRSGGRQSVERRDQCLSIFLCEGRGLRGRGRVPVGDRGRAQGQALATAGGSSSVASLVRDDLEQPRPERRVRPEPGERVVGLHECLLGRVLRLAAVARDEPGDTEGDLPVPLHQLLVCRRRRPLGLAVRARRPPVVGPPRELFPSRLLTPRAGCAVPASSRRSRRAFDETALPPPGRETYPVEGCPSPFAWSASATIPAASPASSIGTTILDDAEPPICLSVSRYCKRHRLLVGGRRLPVDGFEGQRETLGTEDRRLPLALGREDRRRLASLGVQDRRGLVALRDRDRGRLRAVRFQDDRSSGALGRHLSRHRLLHARAAG